MIALLLGSLAVSLFGASAVHPARAATTWVVTSGADTTGVCPDPNNCTLRQAMTQAASDDTIIFGGSGTITLGSVLPAVSTTLTIDGSGRSVTLSGNHAVQIFQVTSGGTLSLNALTLSNGFGIAGSSSTYGGAINNFGTVNVTNSTFSGNSAHTSGGAIESDAALLNVTNSTFSGNSAPSGASLYNYNGAGTLNVKNSIITHSTGGSDCSSPLTLNVNNLIDDASCGGTANAVTNLSSALANNGGPTQTFALLAGSNAIDAAPIASCTYLSSGTNPLFSNGATITADQRGAVRPSGAACDSGAYEFVTLDSIGVFRGGTFYLRLHNSTGFADINVAFGPGTKPYPVVGDWTGAGYDTVGVVDQSNGLFMLCTANNTTSCANSANQISFVLGNANDQPLSGKWGVSATHFGAGVFRPSNGLIYLKNVLTTGVADYTMVLGIPGDQGLAGDWNSKKYDSPGVYRSSNQRFYLSNQVCNCSVFGDYTLQYGVSGDTPVVGDWIGQEHDGVGLFRQTNGYTYLRNSLTTGFADNAFTYGIAGDVPVAGHWQLTYPPVAEYAGQAAATTTPTAAPAPSAAPAAPTGVGD